MFAFVGVVNYVWGVLMLQQKEDVYVMYSRLEKNQINHQII